MKSFYLNIGNSTDKDIQEVTPFAIEKKYGKGRIIMVNMKGYLDTLSKSPDFFQTLGAIPNLIGLENDFGKNEELQIQREVPFTRFIGNFDATGKVLINSSSFALVDTYLDSEHRYKGDIFFSNSENGESKEERMEPISEDALIKDLKIVGPYEASVSSNGIFHMPSRPSDYDYVVFSPLLPLDIIIKLHNGSTAEITVGNTTEYFKGGGRSEILIHDLRSGDEGFADILMKNPHVQVINGKSKFSSLYSEILLLNNWVKR